MTATINEIREVIDHAPPPSAVADGLLGWRVADGKICSKCASRIIGRGFGNMLKDAQPIYDQSTDMCDTCFQLLR